jgi:hypothetical protein
MAGIGICLRRHHHSVFTLGLFPGVRFRLKHLLYVKSSLPTGVIALMLVIWPCTEDDRSFQLKECLVVVLCLLVLTINGLAVDFRDIVGDSFTGTQIIVVRLGGHNRIYLLIGLATALVRASSWMATHVAPRISNSSDAALSSAPLTVRIAAKILNNS